MAAKRIKEDIIMIKSVPLDEVNLLTKALAEMGLKK